MSVRGPNGIQLILMEGETFIVLRRPAGERPGPARVPIVAP